MTAQDLVWQPVTRLAPLLARKQISPVELVRAYLDRIHAYDQQLHAYITVCGEAALAAARQAEAEISRGRYRGALHGIPLAVKDQFLTRGVRTTGGTKIFSDLIPDLDATVIRRLREAGAITLGKLNLSEFALGGTRVHPYGTPHNPWSLEHSPLGSSSGSAIAVAASLCAAAIGEDTGGSVRLPAAACGGGGLRPTFGLVSRHGIMPASWSLDTAGPMTKTVADCALVLQAIAGYDPHDRTSSRHPIPDYSRHLSAGIQGTRLGVIRELCDSRINDSEVQTAVEQAIARYRELGAVVQEVSIPLIRQAAPIFIAICDTDGANVHEQLIRSRARDYDAATRTRLFAASLLPANLYHRAQRARGLLRRQMMAALEGVDVLLSPSTATPPPTISADILPYRSKADVSTRLFGARSYSTPYSLAALPAISIPCGFSAANLPIGLQLGGKPFDEPTVLRVAAAYEASTDWHTKKPPLA
ncbi:MAG TPA: amidase [Candidatus Tectomicrobia bacterium]|nr:amidase [Candidatus Tectomicrobia bacterium]